MGILSHEPLLTVSDVYHSSKWYQSLLDVESLYGGLDDDPDHGYDVLHADGTILIQLHGRDVDDHSFLTEAGPDSYGQGLCMYMRSDDVASVYERAKSMDVTILNPPSVNPTPNWLELELRDPDGYYLTIFEQLEDDEALA